MELAVPLTQILDCMLSGSLAVRITKGSLKDRLELAGRIEINGPI